MPDTALPVDTSAALAAAVATMRRGTAFLGGGLSRSGGAPVGASYRARLAGNGLRELDRFLNLLIDAALEAGGGDARPRQANTAAKYRAIAPGDRRGVADHRRLLALGRSRACLFYCDGVVRRPDRRGGATMTLGWPGADGRLEVRRLGEQLWLDAADLGDIARFYRRLADRIGG
ncbi:hypothetical protein [Sphingomonas bacterium]|uniref:hypothetical protein n=1 Tax=Sphingomonas bacterium TaxID=1895847 RepID=UPI001576B8F7|nr:hypothetical protein [Sphingomonas bacterium]